MLMKEDQRGVHQSVSKLNAVGVPILQERRSDGEHYDEEACGDERGASSETDQNQEAEESFNRWQRLAEYPDAPRRKWSVFELHD